MTLFNLCDPYLTFEVKPAHNICSHVPMDACDQVWSKSDKACGRRSKLLERKKKLEIWGHCDSVTWPWITLNYHNLCRGPQGQSSAWVMWTYSLTLRNWNVFRKKAFLNIVTPEWTWPRSNVIQLIEDLKVMCTHEFQGHTI